MKLIITEKPSVARDIARVLKVESKKEGFIEGNGYSVTWALGHLIELCQPDEYAESYKKWVIEDLPMIPESFKTKIIDRSKSQFDVISSLIGSDKFNEIICATDAGREGELIFRLIYTQTDCKLPIKRLWISSQTDTAIKEGFDKLEPGTDYDFLYDSAKSRSEADWIVGINATRAYSIKFSRGHGVMSVGRVQTPVLKLIVDRYREHINFNSKPFYEIFADIKHEKGDFSSQLQFEDSDRVYDKEKADEIKNQISQIENGTIDKLTKKNISEKQPLLYDLTEIQKDANKQFKFSADHTLKQMQSLYEKHKILSYPRTSSRFLSSDIAPKLPQLLSTISDLKEFKPIIEMIQKENKHIAKRMIDDKKVTDHHAIIPTDKKPDYHALSEDEKKVYNLVIKRFLSSFLDECEKDHTEILSRFDSFIFKSTGTIIKKIGWRQLYLESEKELKKKKEILLPQVIKGDPITHSKLQVKKGQTKAPALYTEASILAAMETAGKSIDDDELRQAMKHCGLGTPATRAQILEKLIGVNYIIREKNKLIPTAKGEYIIDSIQDDVLGSAELTGEWEKKLNDMAEGKFTRGAFMEEIKTLTQDIVDKVETNNQYVISADQKVFGSCPVCETGKVVEMQKSYSCSNWKDQGCKFVIWKQIAKKDITTKHVEELFKNGKTKVIKGFKSKTNKPFDASLALINGEVKLNFEQKSLFACPVCDNGNVVETAKAYSCDQWRNTGCKFVIWKEIAKRKITIAEAAVLIKEKELKNVSGFVSKAGKEFSAHLIYKDNRVQFSFDN